MPWILSTPVLPFTLMPWILSTPVTTFTLICRFPQQEAGACADLLLRHTQHSASRDHVRLHAGWHDGLVLGEADQITAGAAKSPGHLHRQSQQPLQPWNELRGAACSLWSVTIPVSHLPFPHITSGKFPRVPIPQAVFSEQVRVCGLQTSTGELAAPGEHVKGRGGWQELRTRGILGEKWRRLPPPWCWRFDSIVDIIIISSIAAVSQHWEERRAQEERPEVKTQVCFLLPQQLPVKFGTASWLEKQLTSTRVQRPTMTASENLNLAVGEPVSTEGSTVFSST